MSKKCEIEKDLLQKIKEEIEFIKNNYEKEEDENIFIAKIININEIINEIIRGENNKTNNTVFIDNDRVINAGWRASFIKEDLSYYYDTDKSQYRKEKIINQIDLFLKELFN